MTIKTIKELGFESSVYFSLSDGTPEYEEVIIGVSTDGNIIYSMEKMVAWLVEKDGITEEQAREHIDYNVIRSLPYAKSLVDDDEAIPPIIMEYEAEDYD